MNKNNFINLLKKEMVVAMGCTEPAAAALTGAKAAQLLGCKPNKIKIFASRDMIKNVMGVGIPNCSLRGIQAAVCLGICGGNPELSLSILSVVTEEQQKAATEYVNYATLELIENVPPVYIKVAMEGDGHTSECVISYVHDNFTSLKKDGEELCKSAKCKDNNINEMIAARKEIGKLTITEIMSFVNNVSLDEVEFVLEGAKTNMSLAKHSIENSYGLAVGKAVLDGETLTPNSLTEAFKKASAFAAAASDARMSGCPKAVVINSGSGNQGITCSVPILIMAEYLEADELKTVRALCISQLVALMLTARKDRLSALCGALTAAIGTSCGFVYLMDGGLKEMDLSIHNMVANLTGIVCDGAKNTCALKIYSCVDAAALSCKMGLAGFAPGKESGIIGDDYAHTIDNLARISHEGMQQTDKTILSIMLAQ